MTGRAPVSGLARVILGPCLDTLTTVPALPLRAMPMRHSWSPLPCVTLAVSSLGHF